MFTRYKAVNKKGFWQRGQGTSEYALLLVLIAVVTIVALSLLGNQTQAMFCTILANMGPMAPEVEACSTGLLQCVEISRPSGVQVEAVASDPSTVVQIVFYLDGANVQVETVAPYCLSGNTSGDCTTRSEPASSGSHVVRAVATTTDGGTSACTITVTAP